jgi:D-cysteine desulfhydrase
MNLSQFPRRRYTVGDTPIEKLSRFSALFNGPAVYCKRDDLLGLAGGGNTNRKLEFLMADALAQGADTIITCGAIQSNHCRLTLAAANKEGLACHLVLEEHVPNSYDRFASGNNFLYYLLGVEEVHFVSSPPEEQANVPGGGHLMVKMNSVAESLRAKGRKPYIIPVGGSNFIGSLGYVACAQEMLGQLFEMDLNIDAIVCTSGSAGTHAGLLTGLFGCNAHIPVIGIGIGGEKEAQRKKVHGLCLELAAKFKLPGAPDFEDVIVLDDYIGSGYSLATESMVEAVKLLAKTEAILLDPVYTGKTMSGLIDLLKKGYFNNMKNILFLHTGGAHSLFAYTDDFFGK